MARIEYYGGLDYDKLPTAKRRKLSGATYQPYVNPAYFTVQDPEQASDKPTLVPTQDSVKTHYTISSATSYCTNSTGSAPLSETYSDEATIIYDSQLNQENARTYTSTPSQDGSSRRNNGYPKTVNGNNQPTNGGFQPASTYGKRDYSQMEYGDDSNYSSSYGSRQSRTASKPIAPSNSTPPDSKLLHDTLKRYFNFTGFRENQLEAVNASCQGLDTLILMPTGGGKSICYQLPAILSNGLSIVVSPLKSLIADQVDRMQSLNVKTSALSGETKETESESIYQDLRSDWPEHKLLYVTPEKINASGFLMSVFKQLYDRNLLSRFVIDEAHCVSTWGADFRPDYRKLGKLRQMFPRVPIMALTATAPPQVRDDILDQLGMDKSMARVFIQSFNRPNLKFEVRDKSKGCLMEICKSIRANFKSQCGIIYCLSRNDCEQVSRKLREEGVTAAPYHAGLSDESRKKVFAAWSKGIFQVVCATIAFGMGIDKSDVRFVIHYSMPKSVEGYYQEAGRAGRDGKMANCILYFSKSDLYRMKSMLNKPGFGRKSEDRTRDVGNLQHMIDYVDNKTECRRTILLRYLGENFNSDQCVKRPDTVCDNCFHKIPRR